MKSREPNKSHFRARISVSQQEMANYLGISLSLLAMWEKGLRTLPADSLQKLAVLEKDFEKSRSNKKTGPSVKQLQQQFVQEDNKMAGNILNKTVTHRPKVKILERRLNELTRKQESQLAWLNFIDHKLAGLPENETTRGQRLWLENRQADITTRLLKANKELAKIRFDIDLLQAVVTVHEAYSQRLKNKASI